MSDEILGQASSTGDAIERKQRRTRWLLWLQWVLVCALGFVIAGSLDLWPVGPVVLGALWIMEAVLWLVAWRRCCGTGWLMVVTLLGLALASPVAAFAVAVFVRWDPFMTPGPWFFAMILLVLGGLPAGLAGALVHWLILPRPVQRAQPWLWLIVVGPVAGGLAAALLSAQIFPAGPAEPLPEELGIAVSVALGGAVYGAMTGAALNVRPPVPAGARGRQLQPSSAAVGCALVAWMAVLGLGWGMLARPISAQHLLVQYQLGKRSFSAIELEGADLTHSNLAEAKLAGANLTKANLTGADLRGAYLGSANLSGADLSGVDLSEAYLGSAGLQGADLQGANLHEASLFSADLTDAKVTAEQLSQAKSLEGATMPDGQVHD